MVKALVASTELDPDQTIVSVDGIGAYDHVSRTRMLTGLLQVPEANQCLPFVRLFYANPSCYVWHDQTGTPFTIHQEEGGEQGDPLMPALYCLGQHAALAAIQQQLNPNEALYAFLDDVYLVVPSQRVGDVLRIVQHQLSTHAHVHLHHGKTRVWNAAGRAPPSLQECGPDSWVGNQALPRHNQGLQALGIPVGSPDYIQHQLHQVTLKHQQLFDRLPTLDDLQASWLLLLFCGSPRANYILRNLPPPIAGSSQKTTT